MKRWALVLPLMLMGCGMSESLSTSCAGSDLEMGCSAVFGSKNNEQDEALAELKKRVNQLNSRIASNTVRIEQLAYVSDETLHSLNASRAEVDVAIASLQNETNFLHTQLTALLTQENVVGLLDPCGNGPGYDEVLLRLSSGRTIAYFKNASNEFLTVLEPGYYKTTDTQACNFTVNTQGLVCDQNGGCR